VAFKIKQKFYKSHPTISSIIFKEKQIENVQTYTYIEINNVNVNLNVINTPKKSTLLKCTKTYKSMRDLKKTYCIQVCNEIPHFMSLLSLLSYLALTKFSRHSLYAQMVEHIERRCSRT